MVPAIKLRRANELKRSVIQLVEPVDVPIHNVFKFHVPRAVTEAKLRAMYTVRPPLPPFPITRVKQSRLLARLGIAAQFLPPPPRQAKGEERQPRNPMAPDSRKKINYNRAALAAQREVLKSASGNAPLYWLTNKTGSS